MTEIGVHPAPGDHDVPDAPREDMAAAFPGIWFVKMPHDSTNHLLCDGEALCGQASSYLVHKCENDDRPPVEPVTSWWRLRDLRHYNLCGHCKRVLCNRLGHVDFEADEYEALAAHMDDSGADELVIVADPDRGVETVWVTDGWTAYDHQRGGSGLAITTEGGEETINPEDVCFVHTVPDDFEPL